MRIEAFDDRAFFNQTVGTVAAFLIAFAVGQNLLTVFKLTDFLQIGGLFCEEFFDDGFVGHRFFLSLTKCVEIGCTFPRTRLPRTCSAVVYVF